MPKLSKHTLDDLKKSGLSRGVIDAMHIKDISPDEMFEIFKSASKALAAGEYKTLPRVRAYEIPYFDLAGKPNGYCRYKLHDEYISPKSKSPAKYLQLPGTKPRFYFPPLVDWTSIANTPEQEIYIVEGEKKATALTQLGFPAIGLGGVWSWRSRENESSDPISDFNLINWKNRKTIIVFDADV